MNGGVGFTGQSPCAVCRSVWQTPEVSSFTRAGRGQFEIGNLQRGAQVGDHRGTHGVGRGVGRAKGVEGVGHGSFPFVNVVEGPGYWAVLRRTPGPYRCTTRAGSWSAGSGRASSCGSRGRCPTACSHRTPHGPGTGGSSW